MLWQEDDDREFKLTDEVVDLVFDLSCRQLPVDHIHALSAALLEQVPWLSELERCAIHEIHVAGSQNGWERPDPALGQRLQLSRRTKLMIRVPGSHSDQLGEALNGVELLVEDCPLRIGKAKRKLLSKQGTIFARHILLQPDEIDDESAFLQRTVQRLAAQGVRVRKALSGKLAEIGTPDGPLQTRSLMLADLSAEESVRLQQHGLGDGRHLGCGIFIPHKGIEAVNKGEESGD